jgi:hypothetical protein
MKNYMILTNPEDIPGNGFIIDDKLQRTFCKCGFVEGFVIKQCPLCGNTDFLTKGISETYLKVEEGVLYLETKRTYYDVARTQSVKTRVTTRSRYEKSKFIHVSNSVAEQYFDDPMVDQFPDMKVAKYLYHKLPKMYNSWFTANRFCTAVMDNYGEISEELIDSICHELGEKSLLHKIDAISSYSNSLKYVVNTLNNMPVVERLLCDCHLVLKSILLSKKYSIASIPVGIKTIIYSYWLGKHISDVQCDQHLAIFSALNIQQCNVDAMIKYYKDNYTNITRDDTATREYLLWLVQNPSGTFKDFNLYKNLEILDKQYGNKKISLCTDNLYQNTAQFFIELSNQINQ